MIRNNTDDIKYVTKSNTREENERGCFFLPKEETLKKRFIVAHGRFVTFVLRQICLFLHVQFYPQITQV